MAPGAATPNMYKEEGVSSREGNHLLYILLYKMHDFC